jgi:hypothetical protein
MNTTINSSSPELSRLTGNMQMSLLSSRKEIENLLKIIGPLALHRLYVS